MALQEALQPAKRAESNWNFDPLTPSKTPARRRAQMVTGIGELGVAALLLVPYTIPALLLAFDGWRRLEIKANESRIPKRRKLVTVK